MSCFPVSPSHSPVGQHTRTLGHVCLVQLSMASGFSASAASQHGISDLRSDVSVTSREMK